MSDRYESAADLAERLAVDAARLRAAHDELDAGDPDRAALARTTMFHPRLNVLDRSVFH